MKDNSGFKQALDLANNWPSDYKFKFIVPESQLQSLITLLEIDKYELKQSTKGEYISFTAVLKMNSSDEVLTIYKKASSIDGIISL